MTETEFKIELAPDSFTAGDYTFDISNAGQFKHDLVIEGPGVTDAKSDTFEGGQAGQLSVTLAPGTYEFYCSIGDHRAKGMALTVTVP